MTGGGWGGGGCKSDFVYETRWCGRGEIRVLDGSLDGVRIERVE